MSAVVISRLEQIFGLIKKQINLLTKKEISYIIFSGGVSELSNFSTLITQSFGDRAVLGNVTELGARNNKYSTVIGMIKYYDARLSLRNASFELFTDDELEELGGKKKRLNISDNSLLGKIFGYFFDN
jgi:cell division ATPase FtsA